MTDKTAKEKREEFLKKQEERDQELWDQYETDLKKNEEKEEDEF